MYGDSRRCLLQPAQSQPFMCDRLREAFLHELFGLRKLGGVVGASSAPMTATGSHKCYGA